MSEEQAGPVMPFVEDVDSEVEVTEPVMPFVEDSEASGEKPAAKHAATKQTPAKK